VPEAIQASDLGPKFFRNFAQSFITSVLFHATDRLIIVRARGVNRNEVLKPGGVIMQKIKNLSAAIVAVAVLLFSPMSSAQDVRRSVFIQPDNGFETYLAAAISKKKVPVDVVTDETKATYVLKSAPLEIKSESTGGKIARCVFESCAGIEDKGTASVQLIEASSSKMVWAYSVNKQKMGSKDEQSMAEAVAKHLKDFVDHNK
jgi:hypothetical protein